MSTDNFLTCANCGKGEEESGSLKLCTACKLVKYCSRDCQKAHRSQHKKECWKRAAELHDEALFKQPPPREDCPICLMRMPSLQSGCIFNACCGKIICCGCLHAGAMTGVDQLCPFCRAPAATSDEEIVERNVKRVEMGDPKAMYTLGCYYAEGMNGMPQDYSMALELWHRSAELDYAKSYYSIGNAYFYGREVERNEKKAIHYWS